MSRTDMERRPTKSLYRIKTICADLDCSESHVKRLVARGVLDKVMVGRFVRITGESRDRHLNDLKRA